MKKYLTIAFSKRETTDVYVFDVLEVNGTNSFKIGCAVVNVRTGDFCSHGNCSMAGELSRECIEAAKNMSRLLKV